VITILLVGFGVLLLLRVPIAVALGLSSAVGLAFHPMAPPVVVAQRVFVAIDSFPLLAVPLFMLAGLLMNTGGISERIIGFSAALVGDRPGGLAYVNVFSSMIFGGISGSAVADTAGVGSIMIPAMRAQRYERPYAAAVTAIASTLGVVIPPSIPMIIIGAMLGTSVGKLFLGGIVPGLLIGLGLMMVVRLQSRRGRMPSSGEAFSLRRVASRLRRATWALLTPIVVVAGIAVGVLTPTEAGAAAVVYALVLAAPVYRELDRARLRAALEETVLATGRVFFLIATAGLYSWLLTANGFSTAVAGFLSSLTTSPTLMLAAVAAILLVVTTFMESIAALVLLLPILAPAADRLGIDPVHFGVVVVIALGVGLVTPPVGLCLFVAADIAEAEVGASARALVPFILMMVALLGLVIAVPPLVTGLPRLFMP
jgi:tripartite ATP-independent transporter DctM subunit